jgi:phage terminase Nu1 subunit (DNA packaging protein)
MESKEHDELARAKALIAELALDVADSVILMEASKCGFNHTRQRRLLNEALELVPYCEQRVRLVAGNGRTN